MIAFTSNPLVNVPDELKQCKQFVCWKYEERDGRRTKVPVEIRPCRYERDASGELTGIRYGVVGRASTTSSSTWLPFDQASRFFAQSTSLAGIGFVFTGDDDYFGVDLDDVRNLETGEIVPWAQELIGKFSTYCEVSPSGTGVKMIGRGRLPTDKTGRRAKIGDGDGEIEIYHRGRFFTLTGQRIETSPTTVNDCQAAIDDLFPELWPEQPKPERHHHAGCCELPDDEIINRIIESRQSAKFQQLWNGYLKLHHDDHSAADMALCSILAFWTGGDAAAVDRLFRQSGLYRAKWDRDDYRDGTIGKAIDGCGDFYGGERNSSSIQDSSLRQTATHCCETEEKLGIELVPGILKPDVQMQFSPCRRIKVRLTNRDDPQQKRISGFACRCNSCEKCKPAWQANRIAWFSGIVTQWPEVYQLVSSDDAEAKQVRARIYRKSKQVENLLYVSIPMSCDQVLWLVNYAVSGFSNVSMDEAHTAVDYAIRDVPDKRRIGCSRALAFQHCREAESGNWSRDKSQGPLTRTTWDRIREVLEESELPFTEFDLQVYERRNITFRVPDDWTDDDSHRLDELMIPNYWAEIGEIVDVAYAGRPLPNGGTIPKSVVRRDGPVQHTLCGIG